MSDLRINGRIVSTLLRASFPGKFLLSQEDAALRDEGELNVPLNQHSKPGNSAQGNEGIHRKIGLGCTRMMQSKDKRTPEAKLCQLHDFDQLWWEMSLAGAQNMFWGSEKASNCFCFLSFFLSFFSISHQMEESLYKSPQPVGESLLVELKA